MTDPSGAVGGAGPDRELFLTALLASVHEYVVRIHPADVSRVPNCSATLRESLLKSLEDRGLCVGRMLPEAQPAGGAFMASETLLPLVKGGWETSRAHTARTLIHQLKGQVASVLGRVLLDRCQWSRPVALQREGFDHLSSWLTNDDAQALKWSLRVNDEASEVALMVMRHRQLESQGAVLRLEPYLKGAVILKVDGTDRPIDLAAELVDRRLNHDSSVQVGAWKLPQRMARSVNPQAPLADIDPRTRLFIVGHGGREARFDPAKDVCTFDLVGDQSPAALADLLVRQGLSKEFSGTVFLDACSSASGAGRTDTYAHRLRDELDRRGYRHLSVAGRPGLSFANLRVARTLPNELHYNIDQTLRRTKALTRGLRGRLNDLRTDPAAAPEEHAVLKRLIKQESGYRRVLEQLRELGPFARHRPELDMPVQASRSDAPPAHEPPRLNLKEIEFATVRDMWGHVGPRSTPQTDRAGMKPLMERLGVSLGVQFDDVQAQSIQDWLIQVEAGRPLPVDEVEWKQWFDSLGIKLDKRLDQQIRDAFGVTGAGPAQSIDPEAVRRLIDRLGIGQDGEAQPTRLSGDGEDVEDVAAGPAAAPIDRLATGPM
ncbi:hypothetical protein [Roseateles amylovorans]|uniref:CHAT domain-containing protein n=1 Tax=Roseateles amylovorans TaxID=2978473 RepID=A0ABY6AUC6_9BURK|nr:hypothetical protein [Roseateles amylovorans]UXH76829.1 hypothetical protein N4261_17550 [Roseateles amylovorans]